MKRKCKIPKFQMGAVGTLKRKYGDVPSWYNPETSKFEEDYFPLSGGIEDIYAEQRNQLNTLRDTYKNKGDEGSKQLLWDFEHDFTDMLEKDNSFAETNTNLTNLNKAKQDLLNYKPSININKTNTSPTGITQNNMWGQSNPMLDEFQQQGIDIASQTSPIIEMNPDQMSAPITTNVSPYTVNQKPITKTKHNFGLNAKNYGMLQGLNAGVNAFGNLYNNAQNSNSIINQSPLSSMQYSNGRSNQSKYGYSFQQGGTKQNPPKVYTDKKKFEQAKRMYNDSLILSTINEYDKKFVPKLKKTTWDKNVIDGKSWDQLLDNAEKYAPGYAKAFYNLEKINKKTPTGKNVPIKLGFDHIPNKVIPSYYTIFKKPVQPVVYQPPQTINTPKVYKANLNTKDPSITFSKDKTIAYLPDIGVPYSKQTKITNPIKHLPNSNIQMKGQPIAIPEMKIPQQGSIPFYGPGNTIVGYIDDNRQFYPATSYTGAQNNQVNLQDKELLNNPELLKKYVSSRDNYKFQQGGFLWNNEDDDFLFEDDEENTTNVTEEVRATDEEIVKEELQPQRRRYDIMNDPLGLFQSKKRAIPQYQPEESVVNNVQYKPSTTNTSANQSFSFNYLQQNGLAPHQAAGLVGNFTQESNVNPTVVNSIGAVGIGQWLGPRKKALFSFAKANGLDPMNLKTQLDFTLHELKTSEKGAFNALQNTKTTQEAAQVVRRKYERPGEHEANDKRRIQEALKLHPYQKGGIQDNNGYLINNLHNFTPKKIINSNHITTTNMAFPIQANNTVLYPNTGDYIFPTNKVIEKPLYQTGGIYYATNADIANLKQKKVKFKYV